MRTILATLLLMTLAIPAATAEAPPEFNAVRTPDSPAFTLLGIAPTQIERPTTPKGFAVALGGLVRNGGAIEVAPYWLWSQATLDEYQTVGGQLLRNFSVSLGTSTGEADAASGVAADTTLGVGVRTSAGLTRDPGCTTQGLAMSTSISGEPSFAGIMAQPDSPAKDALLKALKQEVVDRAASRCVADGTADGPGVALELAAATSVGFAGSELDAGALGSSAAWAALAYRGTEVSVVGLARLRRDRVAGGREYVFVPGARGIYAHGRVAASVEAIAQKQLVRSDAVAELAVTYRATIGLDVRVADATWLTLSFGKDFGDDSSGKLFSLANLKWGYGDPKITAPDPATP